jgi:hypothetical protein
MNASEMLAVVREVWKFDDQAYPELKNRSDEERLSFALNHTFLHQMKALGNVARAIEPVGHGQGLDTPLLHEAVRKMFLNTLMFADLAGLRGDDLEAHLNSRLESSKQKD